MRPGAARRLAPPRPGLRDACMGSATGHLMAWCSCTDGWAFMGTRVHASVQALACQAHVTPPPTARAATHRVAAGLEQQLVRHHVHRQLLVAKGVHARGAGAARSADLQTGEGTIVLLHQMRCLWGQLEGAGCGGCGSSGSGLLCSVLVCVCVRSSRVSARVRTLYAIVRTASDRLPTSCLSFTSGVASMRNSDRESPSCEEDKGNLSLLCRCHARHTRTQGHAPWRAPPWWCGG